MASVRHKRRVLLSTLLLSVWASPVMAQTEARSKSRSQLMLELSDAIRSFDRGSELLRTAPEEALAAFREAHDKFHAVASAGIENGQLYYDLGNTHLRLGEIGAAIADYRRARRLIPGDERLTANLRFARSLRRDNIEDSGKRTLIKTLFVWHRSLPFRTRKTIALVAYGLFWLALLIRLAPRSPALGYAVLICLAGWLSFGVSVGVDLYSQRRLTEGVLVRNQVVVRKGNGEGYEPQYKQPLHEGVEFTVVEQRRGWIEIELRDGSRGWVRQRDVELF